MYPSFTKKEEGSVTWQTLWWSPYLQSARCTHTVVSGFVVLFTHCTLDAISHVIIPVSKVQLKI